MGVIVSHKQPPRDTCNIAWQQVLSLLCTQLYFCMWYLVLWKDEVSSTSCTTLVFFWTSWRWSELPTEQHCKTWSIMTIDSSFVKLFAGLSQPSFIRGFPVKAPGGNRDCKWTWWPQETVQSGLEISGWTYCLAHKRKKKTKNQAPRRGPLPTGHTERSERIPLPRHTSTSRLVIHVWKARTFQTWMISFSRACVKGPSENIPTAHDSFMRVPLMWFPVWSSFMGVMISLPRACVLHVISQQKRRVRTELRTQTPAHWCFYLDQTHQPKLTPLSPCSDSFSSPWDVPHHCRDLIPY